MAMKILQRTGVFAIVLLVSNLFFVTNVIAQDAVGDYRSNATNFNWGTAASWQFCTVAGSPGTWITSTSYPGQNAGTPTVTIRTGNTVTLNVSPANSIGTLLITGTLNASTGALSISGNFTNNGSFTTSTSTITLNSANPAVIAGTSATTFYNLTINTGAVATTVTNTQAVFGSSNALTVTQGNLVLSATNADYSFKNIVVTANGTITHTVGWDVTNKKISVTGNFDVTGIFNPIVRSHVNLNGAGAKTIRTGDNPASTLSILTLNDGAYTANGTLKTNQEVWAMFGTTGSLSTNGNNLTFSSMNNNVGTVNVNGGSLSINGSCEVGYGGSTGTINVSSGVFSIGGDLLIDALGSVICTNSPSINVAGNFTNNGTYTKASETVTLNGAAQTIGGSKATSFSNLALAGSGTKIFGAARTISGNLSVSNGVNANLGTFTSSANTLTLGGSGALNGSWGSSASPATHKNDTYFTSSTGIINISASTCTPPTAFTVTGGGSFCPGGSGVPVGLANSQTGVSYQLFAGAGADGTPVAGTTGSPVSFGNKSAAATYTVVATNATTACTQNMTGNAIVSLYPVPVSSVTASTNISCNGAGDGSITVSAGGGASPYVFSVDDGTNYLPATGTDLRLFTGLLPNIAYKIKVKDNNGCISK